MSDFSTSRFSLRSCLVVLTVVAALGPYTASACSTTESLRESDDRVIVVGTIVGHKAVHSEAGEFVGYQVQPVAKFGDFEHAEPVGITFLARAGLSAACQYSYESDIDELEARYPIGISVTVVYSSKPPKPADMLSIRVGNADRLAEDCDMNAVANDERDYAGSSRRCGSDMFHGSKDLARLPSSDQSTRISILKRLAEFPAFTYFEELLIKYVDDPDERESLMAARYSEIYELGCSEPPYQFTHISKTTEESRHRRQVEQRWAEYCYDRP